MNEIERIEEERFAEEEKDLKEMEKVNGRYSEDIMNSLVNLMKVFLKDHEIYKLMELVADAVATKEQEN